MTYAEQIAAEVAARYGCAVDPSAVQIIQRGVSGYDATAPISWHGKRLDDWKARQRNAKFATAKTVAASVQERADGPEIPKEQWDAVIAAMIADGKTYRVIGARLGVSSAAISKRINRRRRACAMMEAA